MQASLLCKSNDKLVITSVQGFSHIGGSHIINKLRNVIFNYCAGFGMDVLLKDSTRDFHIVPQNV